MKLNRIFILALLGAAILSCGKNNQEKNTPGEGPDQPQEQTLPVPSFAKGADISWVSEMEKDGKTFKKQDGTSADIFDVLKDMGINAIRLRVWVDPYGGWSGKEDLIKLAKRATAATLPIMVDFHYSDFFADPSRQNPPQAWKADAGDVDKMAKHVRDFTTEVLQALKEAGITPAWTQIGNETRNGMLWPTGKLWKNSPSDSEEPGGWTSFIQLYNAGYNAAKAVFPDIVAMPHLNNAFQSTDNDWWLGEFRKGGAKFDMIAFSHYPQTESDWADTQEKAIAFLGSVKNKYGVPVMVSEVGVKTPEDISLATRILSEFMTAAKGLSGCAGVFYWEPEIYNGWKPAVYSDAEAIYKYTGKKETWKAYDMGAFLADGRPAKVLEAFKD